MSEIILNETPVRTSNNFNINNINLKLNIPKKIKSFDSVNIINNDSKVLIEDQTSKIDLNYGLNNLLVNQIIDSSNKKIKIIVDSKTNKDIQINFNFDENNKVLIEDIEIVLNQGCQENIIIKYESNDSNILAYHNGCIRVKAKSGSKANIILANFININSNNFISIQNDICENSKINYYIVDFGGKNSITNFNSNIYGEEAENNINTIYLGTENQIFDINYIVNLYGAKTSVNIDVQGALNQNSKKHFKGTIDFKKGSKKAKGNENESCILLSNTAKSIALPMLLCSEEDVEGNHSSSAGKIDDKELFYIMSRGFSYKDAMKLIVRAKFNKIIEKIKSEELKNNILYRINKILD